jgi:hypothetical protein
MAPNKTQNNSSLDISFEIPQELKDQGIEALQIKGENKCGRRNSLRFNAKYKARYVLNRSRQTMIKPMKLETMRRDYPDMYKEINLYCGL